MKSTKVQTLSADHALVYTEHLVGSVTVIIELNLSFTVCAITARNVISLFFLRKPSSIILGKKKKENPTIEKNV